jgi:hypothetical protein
MLTLTVLTPENAWRAPLGAESRDRLARDCILG